MVIGINSGKKGDEFPQLAGLYLWENPLQYLGYAQTTVVLLDTTVHKMFGGSSWCTTKLKLQFNLTNFKFGFRA